MSAQAAIRAAQIANEAEAHFSSGKGGLFIPGQPLAHGAISVNNNIDFGYESLEEAFPDVAPGVAPLGSLVLVMIRQPKLRSSGGILIVPEDRKTEHDNTQVAKVIAVGPLAYRNRDTFEPWPEGAWCKVGDFVRVPKYQGDRFAIAYTRPDFEIDVYGERRETVATDYVHFAMFKDSAITGLFTGDPLAVRAYLP